MPWRGSYTSSFYFSLSLPLFLSVTPIKYMGWQNVLLLLRALLHHTYHLVSQRNRGEMEKALPVHIFLSLCSLSNSACSTNTNTAPLLKLMWKRWWKEKKREIIINLCLQGKFSCNFLHHFILPWGVRSSVSFSFSSSSAQPPTRAEPRQRKREKGSLWLSQKFPGSAYVASLSWMSVTWLFAICIVYTTY